MCTDFYSSSIAKKDILFKERKDDIYDQNFINQLKTFLPNIKKTIFKGGEPFLIKPYYKIWEAIIETNPSIEIRIITNCTIFNDNIKSLLEKADFYLNICDIFHGNHFRNRHPQ